MQIIRCLKSRCNSVDTDHHFDCYERFLSQTKMLWRSYSKRCPACSLLCNPFHSQILGRAKRGRHYQPSPVIVLSFEGIVKTTAAEKNIFWYDLLCARVYLFIYMSPDHCLNLFPKIQRLHIRLVLDVFMMGDELCPLIKAHNPRLLCSQRIYSSCVYQTKM